MKLCGQLASIISWISLWGRWLSSTSPKLMCTTFVHVKRTWTTFCQWFFMIIVIFLTEIMMQFLYLLLTCTLLIFTSKPNTNCFVLNTLTLHRNRRRITRDSNLVDLYTISWFAYFPLPESSEFLFLFLSQSIHWQIRAFCMVEQIITVEVFLIALLVTIRFHACRTYWISSRCGSLK